MSQATVREFGKPPRCGEFGGHNKRGEPCGQVVLSGTKRCRSHGGQSTAKIRAKVEVRRTVLAWDLDQPLVDPGETLLRLLTVTYARARMLADLLQRAYDAAEALARAESAPALEGELDELVDGSAGVEAARAALRQVLATGGVAVLVGRTRASDGRGGTVDTGEQIRALAALEQSERKLAADLATKAVAAGIAERQVRLAEMRADLWIQVLAGAARRLGWNIDLPAINAAVGAELDALPLEAIMSS
ncbi:hypothetical protein [Pseudofrankia inefficax]|uniref:Uncharacterized protein n=1 Tax=Pseudofrankia inefficax (strain DSM 45817 / CECT 9037 / DDB 130130 / EuI1c) TaxID=298654 RepID=E3J749_PSEI1|nr:hypothetical protein [Pseudofrankia inefficax]ADP84413.1 hypothetical protein FraEuI1c_6432 [Pseudofrankia inefficax]